MKKTLNQVLPGNSVQVAGLDAEPALRCRLLSLGMINGSVLRVISCNTAGNMVVAAGCRRLLMGSDITDKILIS